MIGIEPYCAGMVLVALLTLGSVARADVHEVRIPLRDGKLSLPELSAALSRELGLPEIEYGTLAIDMRGIGRSIVTAGLNKSLGGGCQISVDRDALTIRVDPAKLPHSVEAAKADTRVFTATVAPQATARQGEKYGLILPAKVQADRPMVVLIHGVDCTIDSMQPLAKLLRGEGYQVGFFGYPDDQALADSAGLFTQHLSAYHEKFPKSAVEIVAFSMGGLVARAAVEGPDYPGGVERFIMLAPPNHGSQWAHLRSMLEVGQQWQQWRHDAGWSPSWMITDGLGEAGADLLPESKFLTALNARARREGVKYTIINGDLHPAWELAGRWAGGVTHAIGPTVSGYVKADALADRIRNHHSTSDGPVSIASTRLEGVADVVTVDADHNGLYAPNGDRPPAAWTVIRDRLAR